MVKLIETLGPILSYVAGWFWTTVLLIRELGRQERCRRGNSLGHCRTYHHPSCRLPNPRTINGEDLAFGAAFPALLWPLILPVRAAKWIALHKAVAHARFAEEIERLEREAGIR